MNPVRTSPEVRYEYNPNQELEWRRNMNLPAAATVRLT